MPTRPRSVRASLHPWGVAAVTRLMAAVLVFVGMLGVPAGAAQVGSVTFTVPPGWTSRVERGMATLTPPGGAAAGLLLVIPDQAVTGEARAWFAASVQQLSSDGTVTERSDVQVATMPAGGALLTAAAAVQLAQGTQYRVYTARVTGRSATMYVLVATTRDALAALQDPYVAVVRSAGGPAPATGGTTSGPPTAGPSGLPLATPLPAVKPMNAAQFIAVGGNPETQVIPDEFRCYQEKRGSGLTPEFAVQILPGGKYRTPSGAGTFAVRRDRSLIKTEWKGGPLDGASGYLTFGESGQALSLNSVGASGLDDRADFECYQRGPRENRQLLNFRLRTPVPAAYPCTLTDGSGQSGGTLDILKGGAYRLNGQTGQYAVDFRSDQDHDWSDVDFRGGPLDDAGGSYQEDGAGVRTLSVYRPKMECRVVVKPTPIPRYGSARAPAPPKGSGGLSGAYATWYPDPLAAMGYGGCGGLCWDVYVFDRSGYVYASEPGQGLDEADCARTHPNGLPVCEVYRVQGGRITVGKDRPVPLARMGTALKIDGRTYQPLLPLEGVNLSGSYTSTTVFGGGMGTVSGGFQTTVTFLPQGAFTRARSGGISATTTDTGTNQGTVTGGVTVTSDRSSRGTYRVAGYTLTLTYGDGHVEKLFAYALPGADGRPDLGLLRLGGASYIRPDRP